MTGLAVLMSGATWIEIKFTVPKCKGTPSNYNLSNYNITVLGPSAAQTGIIPEHCLNEIQSTVTFNISNSLNCLGVKPFRLLPCSDYHVFVSAHYENGKTVPSDAASVVTGTSFSPTDPVSNFQANIKTDSLSVSWKTPDCSRQISFWELNVMSDATTSRTLSIPADCASHQDPRHFDIQLSKNGLVCNGETVPDSVPLDIQLCVYYNLDLVPVWKYPSKSYQSSASTTVNLSLEHGVHPLHFDPEHLVRSFPILSVLYLA